MSSTVILVEDMAIVREGLKALISTSSEFSIAGEASNGIDALRIVDKLSPDIVLMDLTLPLMDGTEAIREIKRKHPHTRVLALTAHKQDTLIYRTLSAGADGYLLKNASREILFQAMQTVLSGKRFISPEISEVLINDFLRHGSRESGSLLDVLSDREKQVLKLVAEGHGNKAVAEALCISHKTVEKHKANLKQKLGVSSTAELVTFAIEHGLTVTE